jgi:hypothetical protein
VATKAEIIGKVTVLLGATLDTTTGSTMASTTSSDPKYPADLIDKTVLDAIASVASTVARSPLQADTWLFCLREPDLGSGDGQLFLDPTVITGPIVAVDVSYDASAFTYKHAEPDSATAIEDYRTLRTAGRRTGKMRSYAIVGRTLYYPGTRVRITYVPGDVGETDSDIEEIPRKYVPWIEALALALLFGRDGTRLAAAQHYKSFARESEQLALGGSVELPEYTPYQGS